MALMLRPEPFAQEVNRLFNSLLEPANEQKERGYYRVERTFGRSSRSLQLPEGIDPDSVSAEFDKGVLSIRIPKPEERKPRRVQIKAGDNGSPKTVQGTAT